MDASDYCKKVSLCELHTFRVPEHAAPAQHLAPARKMAREEYCARSKAGSAAGHRAGAGGRRAGKSNGGTWALNFRLRRCTLPCCANGPQKSQPAKNLMLGWAIRFEFTRPVQEQRFHYSLFYSFFQFSPYSERRRSLLAFESRTRPGRRLQCPSPARGEGVSPPKGCALKIGASLGWNWNSLTVDLLL